MTIFPFKRNSLKVEYVEYTEFGARLHIHVDLTDGGELWKIINVGLENTEVNDGH